MISPRREKTALVGGCYHKHMLTRAIEGNRRNENCIECYGKRNQKLLYCLNCPYVCCFTCAEETRQLEDEVSGDYSTHYPSHPHSGTPNLFRVLGEEEEEEEEEEDEDVEEEEEEEEDGSDNSMMGESIVNGNRTRPRQRNRIRYSTSARQDRFGNTIIGNTTYLKGNPLAANVTRPRQYRFSNTVVDGNGNPRLDRVSSPSPSPSINSVTRPMDVADIPVIFTAYSLPECVIGTIDKVIGEVHLVRGSSSSSRFKMKSPGLNGRPDSVSLECPTKQGHFLRYKQSFLRLDPLPENSQLDPDYMNDATFFIHNNTFIGGCVAIAPNSYPGNFLCHQQYRMMFLPYEDSESYRKEASFIAKLDDLTSNTIPFPSRGNVRAANATQPREGPFHSPSPSPYTRPLDVAEVPFIFTAYSRPKFVIGTNDIGEACLVGGKEQGFKLKFPGLSGRPGSVSLECPTKQGHFLRQRKSLLRVDPLPENFQHDPDFMNDATFFFRNDDFINGCVSIESSNYPSNFVCHQHYRMMLLPVKNSESYRKDASFTMKMSGLTRKTIPPPSPRHGNGIAAISTQPREGPFHKPFEDPDKRRLNVVGKKDIGKEREILERKQVEELRNKILQPPRVITLKSRNKCLIISNKFGGKMGLAGYKHDEKNIRSTFETLNFDVLLKTDVSAQQMKDEFKKLQRADFSKEECFATFILSHGESDRRLQGSDKRYVQLDFLIDLLSNCVSLHGKPKLIFVQACRGDDAGQYISVMRDKVKGHMTTTSTSREQEEFEPEKEVIRQSKDADTLVYYATTEGKYSYVCEETGSFFIQAVCKVFNAYGTKYPLSGMITKINEIVSRHIVASLKGNEVYVEACEVSHRLTCDIFFSSSEIKKANAINVTTPAIDNQGTNEPVIGQVKKAHGLPSLPANIYPDDASTITTPSIDQQKPKEPVRYQIKKLENIIGKVIKHVFPDGRLPLSDGGSDSEPHNHDSYKNARSADGRNIMHKARDDSCSVTTFYSDEDEENYRTNLSVRVVGSGDDEIYTKKVYNGNNISKDKGDVRINIDMESLDRELLEVQRKIEENKKLIMAAAKRICRGDNVLLDR